jgi:pimeloyl-ACP methyl ester carboxylesterase
MSRSRSETVVFVHGLWMTGLEMGVLRHRVAATGFDTRRFHYRTVRESVADNAIRLRAFLEHLAANPLHLVGHSLGGLVILHLFHELGWRRPGQVVFMGAPVRGSRAARAMANHRLGARLLGGSGPDALAANLPAPVWPGPNPLGVVVGTWGAGMGQFFHRLPRPHDGTVAADETEIRGATDRIALPVSHLSMLFNREVAAQVAHFLHFARFSPASP